MTYATEEDIRSELKEAEFEGDTLVTAAAIADFLAQEGAKIHAFIAQRYTTPISENDSPQAYALLKKIEIDLVTYRVVKVMDKSKSVPIPDERVVTEITEGTAYNESMKMLYALQKGKIDLPDATETDPDAGFGSFHSESINSDVDPVFDVTEQQW